MTSSTTCNSPSCAKVEEGAKATSAKTKMLAIPSDINLDFTKTPIKKLANSNQQTAISLNKREGLRFNLQLRSISVLAVC
jgi:hypothetical protein